MNPLPDVTVLNSWHKQNNAHMAVFAGYEMPLWYPAGTKQEHLSVITHAGLFDTSHMAAIRIFGLDAFHLLQDTFSRDLARWNGKPGAHVPDGRCVYGVFLNSSGEVIDDAVVYKIADDCFMVVVNAGMGSVITAHLNACRENLTVEVQDLTGRIGKMDIQGPLSARVLERVLPEPSIVLEKMVYFSFKGLIEPFGSDGKTGTRINEVPVMVSRSGYTGEFGFELYMDSENLVQVWNRVYEAGQDFHLQACGLASRDSLRAGAVLPLSHQDIGSWPYVRHPWMFSLPYHSNQRDFTKPFIGSEALLAAREADYTYPFAGFDPRKIVTENAVVTDLAGNPMGKVLTCTTDMAVSRHGDRIYSMASPDQPEGFRAKGLACGFIKVKKHLEEGAVVLLADDRRKIKVRIEKDIRPDRTARCAMAKMISF